MNIIKNIFTARDNATYSLTKLVGLSGTITMIVQFVKSDSGDYMGFGAGIALMMAALAGKYFVEQPPVPEEPIEKE